MLHSRQAIQVFKMIQHMYNLCIIEPPYYKAYLRSISVQKALRCLSVSYLKRQTCCSNCYLHTNRVDVLKSFGRVDKGLVISPMLSVCVTAYLQKIAGSWGMMAVCRRWKVCSGEAAFVFHRHGGKSVVK